MESQETERKKSSSKKKASSSENHENDSSSKRKNKEEANTMYKIGVVLFEFLLGPCLVWLQLIAS